METDAADDISTSIHTCCCFLSIVVFIIVVLDHTHPVTIILGIVFYIVVFCFICLPPCFYHPPFTLTTYFCCHFQLTCCAPKSPQMATVVPIPLATESNEETHEVASIVNIKHAIIV